MALAGPLDISFTFENKLVKASITILGYELNMCIPFRDAFFYETVILHDIRFASFASRFLQSSTNRALGVIYFLSFFSAYINQFSFIK